MKKQKNVLHSYRTPKTKLSYSFQSNTSVPVKITAVIKTDIFSSPLPTCNMVKMAQMAI